MKKITKAIFIVLLLFSSATTKLFSQQAVVSAGGNATGSGGSSSYSVGQLAYSYQTGTTGSVAQGVQQAFEISTLIGEEFTEILLEAKVYPNPVIDNLTLSIKNSELNNVNYQLYDIQGKIIKSENIKSDETNITLENNSSGTYFLKINLNKTEIKSFKIIKN